MNRRTFLGTTGAVVASTLVESPVRAANVAVAERAAWRHFEVTTDIELRPDAGVARLWLPLPLAADTDYFRSSGITWTGNPARAGIHRDAVYGAAAFFAEWDDPGVLAELSVKNVFATRDRVVNLAAPQRAPFAGLEEPALYVASTAHIPTDGIVAETARKAVKGRRADPVVQARAIYEWIVENTYRDPKVSGCGTGDIVSMLESGNLGGKCADLNALFVGLARACGIPARDVYGVRVADSATWKSLGRAGDISKAQHCRAEFFDTRFGWVPVDPADVRKVVLEEAGDRTLPLDDPRVALARQRLFGSWEMNWLPYNWAGDTSLAPATRRPLGHFMYPHAETTRGVLDPYSPDLFRYKIASREVAA